jgi:hypothetical protein
VESDDDGWERLGADPGLCRRCQHPKLTVTKRGSAFLRCTRHQWDERVPRHPELPVRECVGFEAVAS